MTGVPQVNARHLMLTRLRKGKQCVPGTYMSAAGIQTELSPGCLHKVAVHEAVYRKHVNVYRQDLEQKVDKLNKNQNMLKKSMRQYKIKKRENKRKRYHAPSSAESDVSLREGPSKQMLIIVDENGKISKPIPIKRQDSKRRNNSFNSPSLVSDSGIELEFNAENTKENLPAQDEVSDLNSSRDSEPDKLRKEFVGLSSASDLAKPVSTPLVVKEEGDSNTKPRTRKKGTSTSPRFKPPKRGVVSRSLDNIPSHSSSVFKEDNKSRKSKSAAGTSESINLPITESLPPLENTETSKGIAETWPMAVPKQKTNRKADSQTSAFMQLVRMKQNNSMSKNINMIDKLISGSKNKRLVYLRRISEVSDTGLSQLRGQHSNSPKNSNTDPGEDSVDNSSRPLSRHVKLPPLEIEPDMTNDNPIEVKYKRAMRRISIAALQPAEPLVEVEEGKAVEPPRHSAKAKSRAQREMLLRSEQMTSSRDINKFIQDEKEVVALNGKNVTWQQSLAKLREVHYVFPSKIVEEKGFIV